MATPDLEDESLRLALQCHLDDLEALSSSGKGKNRADEPSDADLALALYKTQVEAVMSSVGDRVFSRSLTQAGQDDESMLSILLAAKMTTLDISSTKAPQTEGESSSWAATRKRSDIPLVECVCCGETVRVNQATKCPCSHSYCNSCLWELFHKSLGDESLFPPRCCKMAIPLEIARNSLPAELAEDFIEKEIEYGTLNRTCCHQPACSTFIPDHLIEAGVGSCPNCQADTCSVCKTMAHSDECPEDTMTQDVLRVANENGWKRCYSCKAMVELNVGCNHITCRCRAQFCYVCGAEWKTCQCPQWHEERLLARANEVVDRNAGNQDVIGQAREQMVARERVHLIENHECQHGFWNRRRGPHTCEECRYHMPDFHFECRQCHIIACKRCRHNRL